MVLFAMLFPGQGSQYKGMLSSFFYNKKNNIFKYTFDEASSYLKYNLLELIEKGPSIKLNYSKYTQPAILTSSVSIYRLWKKMHGKNPSLMAGHSLGEYSALVCSHSMKFSDALKIVSLRGELMEAITKKTPALIQAVIGIDNKIVKNVCSSMSKNKIVSLASINSDEQVIISGEKSAVEKTSLACKKLGAKYILDLNINIPAHCLLMKPMAKKIKKVLNTIKIKSPNIPVINNFNVTSEVFSKRIKNALTKQIYNTVRWTEIIELIKSKKIFTMLEVGPKKILTNFNKNNKTLTALSTNNLENFFTAFKKINQ